MLRLAPLFLLCASSCLAGQLRAPAEDHSIQAQHIARACASGVYGPCSAELVEDLEFMAHQACLIDAIAKKADGKACGPQGGESE